MDYDDVFSAVTDALSESAKRDPGEDTTRYPDGMIAIQPFEAASGDDEPVRVVGIGTNKETDMFDFIVIKTMEDGEMYPTFEPSVWAKPALTGGDAA
ncbi:hypothetical protein QEZ48_21125 [Aquamicrobium lusatiense]|uniref:hypothetical protein n=1 Tax=Aquamicrobium lusatiense TaxID=89772 RepID=UPI00245557DA|nr:hypothetical protein [Aquamicrobium lusatiense]MDH4993316.1 hypothetical protein [Aquamicrobium lusatiense]